MKKTVSFVLLGSALVFAGCTSDDLKGSLTEEMSTPSSSVQAETQNTPEEKTYTKSDLINATSDEERKMIWESGKLEISPDDF